MNAERSNCTQARFRAWLKIIDAVADMKAALEFRCWRADPDDIDLEADVQTYCELATALADFLKERRDQGKDAA